MAVTGRVCWGGEGCIGRVQLLEKTRISDQVENIQSSVGGPFNLKRKMTARSFLVSGGTPNSTAFCFYVYHYVTFISFNGFVFHASSRECREEKAAGAGLRMLTPVGVTEVAQGQKPPEPLDPKSSFSLLRNWGVGEVKGHLFSEHLPN